MRNDGDWILNGMYAESTKIREKLSAEVWRNIRADQNDPGLSPGYSVEYVEVFIGNRYWGVYGLSERIDEEQLGLEEGDRLYWSIASKTRERLSCRSTRWKACTAKAMSCATPRRWSPVTCGSPSASWSTCPRRPGTRSGMNTGPPWRTEESAADYLLDRCGRRG